MRLVLPLFFMGRTGLYLDVAISHAAHCNQMRAAVVHSVVMHHPFRANGHVRRHPDYEQQYASLKPLIEFYCGSSYVPRLRTLWLTFTVCSRSATAFQ